MGAMVSAEERMGPGGGTVGTITPQSETPLEMLAIESKVPMEVATALMSALGVEMSAELDDIACIPDATIIRALPTMRIRGVAPSPVQEGQAIK